MDVNNQNIGAAFRESDFPEASVTTNVGHLAHLRVRGDHAAGRTAGTSRLRICLPQEAMLQLERVCRNNTFLTWTALVAGAVLYLNRYARADLVAIAAPPRKDTVGMAHGAVFPALLEVKLDVTFREFLQSCRTQLSALYTKPSSNAKKLVDAGFKAPNSHCPFQVGIGHAALHRSLPGEAADIRIDFDQQDGSLYGNVVFDNSLFAPQSVSDFLSGQFELLSQGLKQPDLRCSELSMVPLELARKSFESAKLHDDTELIEDFVDLFERIALQQPNSIAVRENQIAISYGELDIQADEVARLLVLRRTQDEELIGVAMNRSVTAIAAILGIWKAGAAYLPCDLNLPRKRFLQILQDSGTRLVLTDRDLKLPLDCKADAVQIGQLSSMAGTAVRRTGTRTNLERLAYSIYTSGSTGNPKGVMLSHRGLATLVRAQRRIFTTDECRDVLQFSAHSFDASIFDITMALGHGGTLHMSGDLQIPTGEPLFEVLKDQQITLATMPPCVVATLQEEELPDLKTLVVAGEACPQALVDQWAERVRLVNAYGPTETTVWATYEECTTGVPITIGNAIPGCRTHVLDQYLQPLPAGCPGELCLSGENLARGFLGLAAATALQYVPNPMATEAGERLYRTGDLVVLRQDGRIEFLGRADDQYKIRGFRIELGDIEAAARAHPQLEQAAVVVKDEPGDAKTIVAFVVPSGGSQVTTDALREFAMDHLPEYMVPSQWVILEKMPLTRSGKTDRHALLQLARATQSTSAVETGKPESYVEEVLTAMWAELLKRKQVGPEENFFQLGGNSLVAIRIVSRIKKIFAVQLPARAIFESPTVRAIAQRVEAGSPTPQTTSALVQPAVCLSPTR